ncbi:MAG: hypothetical protein ACX94B_09260 [Henriciella sp.]
MIRAVLAGVFGLVTLGAIGAAVDANGFDFDAASPDERQVWLDEEAKVWATDIRSGLFSSGVKKTQMDLQNIRVDQEKQLVDIIIVVKGSVRTYRPKNFRMQFLETLCPGYARSAFGKIDYRTRIKLVRENGDVAVAENLSNSACDQFRAFKKRQSSA